MNNNLTEIVVVADRSGSMDACRSDAEGGINNLIAEHQKADGECNFTLVQFNTHYEFIHKGVPIKEVKERYKLIPAGHTALNDAVGRAIDETGERLRNMPEHERPGLVCFVIATDGLENSSREYSKAQVNERIEHQQNVYNWQFTYLGANQDAFKEGAKLGVDRRGTANYSVSKTREAWGTTTDKLKRMRTQASRGLAVDNSYTQEELKSMND